MTFSYRTLVLVLLTSLAAAQSNKSMPTPPATHNPAPIPVPMVPTAADTDSDPLKEAAIFERAVTKVVYESDGTGTRETTVAMRVQSQAGVQQLAVLSFPYTSSNETVELDYVRVSRPDGTVVVTPDYNVQDMPAEVTRNAPMYSDIHEKHVTVKGLGVGDLLEYVVRYRTLKPEIPGQFWYEHTFTKLYIVKVEELDISVPRDKDVKISSPDLQPKIHEEGGRKIYTWRTSNLNLKDRDALLKKTEAPKPTVQITTFHNWEEVGRWYKDLQQPALEVTPQIKAKAAELTKGLSSDDDKIRAIYNYVSTKFHYVSLSFGIGRYRPHAAEDVMENEYGDCKDKHTLLATLLRAAGFEVWPALINATTKVDPDVPSPGQFNHVITVVPRGKTLLWLDTTPEVSPFGLLLANLRDKQALVMPTDKPAALMTTPAEPPFPSLQTFTTEGKLSADGTLTAHVEQTLRGDAEVLYRSAFRNVPPAQWQDLGQRVAATEGFGGDVSNVSASAPDQTDKPFVVSWDYTRKNFGDWPNHQILAPVPWFGVETASTQDKKPEDPVKLGALGDLIYKAKVALPAGYAPAYSSKADLSESFADYHATYLIENGVLTLSRKLTIKKDDVSLDSWETYKKFSKALADERDRFIDLTNGKTVYPSGEGPNQTEVATTTPPATPTNPEVAKLMQEGGQASQNRDLTRAEEDYKRVIQLDPKFPGVHASLGWIYCTQNNIEGCLREWRKEEEYHPDNVSLYTMSAKMLEFLHRNDEALEQYRELLKRDPGNRDAALAAARMLSAGKKDPEAVDLLEKAVERSPDSPALEYALASAYVGSKQSEKGIAILKKAVAADSIPIMLNNAAYVLAENNVALDLAQDLADKAVRQTEEDSLKTEDDDAALVNTRQLSAFWDTLGWILFRKGNLDKARPYLKTAWILSQRSSVCDHLGQLYERQGKKNEAAHQYQLAVASPFSGEDTEVSRKHYKQLTGRDPVQSGPLVLHQHESGSGYISAGEELSRMRTTKLLPKSAKSGSAVFTVVFVSGKVDKVRYASGDKSLETVESKITSPPFSLEFPDQGRERIVRRGILTCGIVGCDFTFLLPDNNPPISLNSDHN